MMKTKLGVSVGLLGAAVYLLGLYGGYVVTILLVGYILLFEDNAWLRKSAVKALVLLLGFSVLSSLVYLIPHLIGFVSDVIGIFGGSFYVSWIASVANAVSGAFGIIEQLLFIGLGIKALVQGTIAVPAVDNLIDKYVD